MAAVRQVDLQRYSMLDVDSVIHHGKSGDMQAAITVGLQAVGRGTVIIGSPFHHSAAAFAVTSLWQLDSFTLFNTMQYC